MDEVILPEMGRLFEQELTLEGSSCLDCHPFDASLPLRSRIVSALKDHATAVLSAQVLEGCLDPC